MNTQKHTNCTYNEKAAYYKKYTEEPKQKNNKQRKCKFNSGH